jgi:uncharacterized protein YjaG (DUF416 family)
MDESTRIILSRRFAELDRAFEVSDKNVDKIIQILATKTGREPEEVKRKAEIVKANAAQRKLRNEMVRSLREAMDRNTAAAVIA